MPASDKRTGRKKRKPVKLLAGGQTPTQVMKRLLKTYDRYCTADEGKSFVQSFRRGLRESIRLGELCVKFMVHANDNGHAEGEVLSILPMINALRVERYFYIRFLFVWDIPLVFDDIASMADLLGRGTYPLKHLELMDCLIDVYPITRLARSFNSCSQLSTIVLDYNEFGDAGCLGLCDGLRGNCTVLSLSLNYCDLGVASGESLGMVLATTAVRELYVDGNNLECEGLTELIRACVDRALIEVLERDIVAEREEEDRRLTAELEKELKRLPVTPDPEEKNKTKKKRKKKVKAERPPPPVGPWLHKLHIADNGIDARSRGGTQVLFDSLQMLAQLIRSSKCLLEVDFEDNLIGDLGGHEIMEALQGRKEARLPNIKMRTTHRMQTDTLAAIIKLAIGLPKKKTKRKKKAK